MNSEVLKTLTKGEKCTIDNEADLRSKRPKTFTATISGAKSVYSAFPGKVLFLGYYKGMGTVTVSISNHEMVRYLNLTSIASLASSELEVGQYIGDVFPNKPFQFEYCSQWKGDSIYPVRIDNDLYFKQNPMDILDGTYIPNKEIVIDDGLTLPRQKVTFTADESLEWVEEPEAVEQHYSQIDENVYQITDPKDIPPSVLEEFTNSGGLDDE